MKKRTVLFFTDTFPFGNGETFIETEMLEWEKRDDVKIIIFPLLNRSSNSQRRIPKNATIDLRLNKILYTFEKKIAFLFPVIFLNPFFWKEICKYPKVLLNPKQLRRLVAASTFSKVIYWFLKKNYAKVLKKDTVFYSYWFYYAAYAGALLKREGFEFKLITRAHGTDIFQNRPDTSFYIPFRRFEIWKNIDCIYPASKNGTNYLMENQLIPSHKLKTSLLGINTTNTLPPPTTTNSLNIVSCSNIINLKRIDLIIYGIKAFAEKHKNITVTWQHIGNGPQKSKIELLAQEHLKSNNIKYTFHGFLSNQKVFEFYSQNSLDCFVTTSESEGGNPVSIMEAMSFGIPVLATKAGGIPETVNNDTGVLLDIEFTINDFTDGLNQMLKFKNIELRTKIASWAKNRYNAQTNYSKFITSLLKTNE